MIQYAGTRSRAKGEAQRLATQDFSANIIPYPAERGIDESLKAPDPLLWVHEMNNCKASAEEIVLAEMIYR